MATFHGLRPYERADAVTPKPEPMHAPHTHCTSRGHSTRYASASAPPVMLYNVAISVFPGPASRGKMNHIQCDDFAPRVIAPHDRP